GALTFAASLHHLVATPRQQGWNWDVVLGNPNSQPESPDAIRDAVVPKLIGNPFVGAFSSVATLDGVTVDGRSIDFFGVEAVRGSVFPTTVGGRVPSGPDEVVL